ncbi:MULTISPECIES: Xaa-Pro peptidase family protein [unclassified Methanoregula]|uniref:M24 family metallopeptidase n=1 Tax=unclassified Methanoregula TaxID=2649730 RepID=UPI0009C89396|nr:MULTISPECIES: Xaa-Pro peptidase family protein [unclassified Methanoregula]OPX61786.1 MAG: Xaa-Pro dipeptidase [Methanoregula sp. PtaB.Bin085]OPY33905.1 MAG: Xaa-Pro dipeptidase [Methanoregula sp. PtaU1.Bin006]
MKVPLTELDDRLNRFRARMDARHPGWELAAITGRVPLYYFTGTIQDGLLLIPQDGDAVFWVRHSHERAVDESLFPSVRRMKSYRDIAAEMKHFPETIYLETEIVPHAQLQRIQKHLRFRNVKPVDDEVGAVRARKSPYELALMEHAGRIHRHVLEDLVPGMLAEGMDEVSLICDLFTVMVKEGHQGLIRFGGFNEMLLGQIGFGTSSLCPTCTDTPGGVAGMHPAVPQMGNPKRKLKKGDLVVVDIGCGYKGYQTDKTLSYMFGKAIPDAAIQEHLRCVEIQDIAASMLKPGTVPSEIYRTIMAGLEPAFLKNFMGFGERQVKFLGHGIGLWIDETPVIAEGFDEPLEEGMVIALEPKKGIADVGLVGIENTFVVTPQGGRSLTGKSKGLVEVF